MPTKNSPDPLRPTLQNPNPENLTEKQILEAIYAYLAEAYNAPKPDKPSPHRAALDRFFPAFSDLYLTGASLRPFTGDRYTNLRGEPVKSHLFPKGTTKK